MANFAKFANIAAAIWRKIALTPSNRPNQRRRAWRYSVRSGGTGQEASFAPARCRPNHSSPPGCEGSRHLGNDFLCHPTKPFEIVVLADIGRASVRERVWKYVYIR